MTQSRSKSGSRLRGHGHRGLAPRVLSCSPGPLVFLPKHSLHAHIFPPLRCHLTTGDLRPLSTPATDVETPTNSVEAWDTAPRFRVVLSRSRSSVVGRRRRRCCPLAVARPAAISSFAVAARGELACALLPRRKLAGMAIACRSLRRYWIASACEVFDEMGELKFVTFHL
jgi:hypothetical protein